MSEVKIRNPKVEGEVFEPYEPLEGEIGRREIEIDGRKFLAVAVEPWGFFKIKNAGGGVVPHELSGDYTDVRLAQQAIETYLANQQ